MADYGIPKSGVAYIFYGCLVSQADTKLFKSAPTLATGDFKVSIDGGAFANLATLPTNTPGTFAVKFSLSSSEMTGDNILVVASDAAGAEWCDQCWNIQTSPRGIADLAYPATTGRSLAVDTSGRALADVDTIKTNPVVNAGTVTFPTTATLASTTNITAGTIATVTNLTNLPSIPANWLTAAGIAAAALNGKGDWNIGKTGYSLTATTGLGNQTADITGSLSGSVGSVTGLTAANLDVAISTRMATYTQPTGFLAASFPLSVGDATAANQTTINTNVLTRMASYTQPTGFLAATFPATVSSYAGGAVDSVTGNVGGNVVGSVGSVTAAVAITSNIKTNQALANFAFLMTDSTNHNPVTGQTVTVTRSIDGAAFAAGTLSAVTEIANGWYRCDFGAGDLNGKVIVLRATAAGCDDAAIGLVTQP